MTQNNDASNGEKILVRADPDLADLIPGFLANRLKDIATMQDALARGDFEAVRILGHSMKGAGGGYGFDAITEIGAALEQAAKGKDSGSIGKGLLDLFAYLDRVEVIYD
ncbi:MAG: Hpt domain-containing protein [Nitrospirae bacterium]|nr:MAG: Hpt domain-containing protein [Nitrospirota bacterium]